MPSSKPAGALTLASRTLNPRAVSSHRPRGRWLCTVASPSLLRADLVRSRLLVRLGRAVCLRVWSGVRRTLDVEGSLPLSMAQDAVMRARVHSPAGVCRASVCGSV